jgi:hypothetical protein
MLKISDSLKEIVESNNMLEFGLQHRLFNLSQLTKFLKPLVEVRVKKEVGDSALLMSLSRLQRESRKEVSSIEEFPIINLTVHSELASMTFLASSSVLKKINQVYAEVQKKKNYMTLSQGTSEITIIINENLVELVTERLGVKPIFVKNGLSSVGLKFNPKYNDVPGFFYHVLQKVALQGISIHEISSTYTELILYIEQGSIKLAFDTLYSCFPESKFT